MKIALVFILFYYSINTNTGYVKYYNEEKNFGYIYDYQLKDEIYVYNKNVIDEIKQYSKVNYKIRNTRKGYEAFDVRLSK